MHAHRSCTKKCDATKNDALGKGSDLGTGFKPWRPNSLRQTSQGATKDSPRHRCPAACLKSNSFLQPKKYRRDWTTGEMTEHFLVLPAEEPYDGFLFIYDLFLLGLPYDVHNLLYTVLIISTARHIRRTFIFIAPITSITYPISSSNLKQLKH